MAKKNEIEVKPATINFVPDYVQDAGKEGTESLGQYVLLNRFKIIQKQASQELLDIFGFGEVILSPVGASVSAPTRDERGQPKFDKSQNFKVTPIYFFTEYCKWNALGQKPVILERSLDPRSDLAKACADPERRTEPHPSLEGEEVRNCEHLNFICFLHDSDHAGSIAVMSFSRAEFNTGRRFASLIKMRNAPIYSGVYEVSVTNRANSEGSWYGFEIVNPTTTSPWVDAELFNKFQELHREYAANHDRLQTQYDDLPESEVKDNKF